MDHTHIESVYIGPIARERIARKARNIKRLKTFLLIAVMIGAFLCASHYDHALLQAGLIN